MFEFDIEIPLLLGKYCESDVFCVYIDIYIYIYSIYIYIHTCRYYIYMCTVHIISSLIFDIRDICVCLKMEYTSKRLSFII